MAKNKENKYTQNTQIDELTAIYDDYLHITRAHERLLHESKLEALAEAQYQDELSGLDNWRINFMTAGEKKDFADFIENYVSENNNHAYITLRHVKPEEDQWEHPFFHVPPYRSVTVNMMLPSAIEQYKLSFSQDIRMGEAVFYIDGKFKASYVGENGKDELLRERLNDWQTQEELDAVINLCEYLKVRENVYDPNKFWKSLRDVCAAKRLIINEDIVLEVMGSFAEKFQSICLERYGFNNTEYSDKNRVEINMQALQKAQEEGLITSAADFMELINIRNFTTHRWDSMNDLSFFSKEKADKKTNCRNQYVNSYLKIFDQSIIQRSKSYIDVLHQMQQIIGNLNPNRIIRGAEESNNKFIARLKELYRSNPQQNFMVELNYPLFDDKLKSLNKSLQKILPQTTIVDNFADEENKIAHINDYITRSNFLHTFQTLAYSATEHCALRGKNFRNRKVWNYLAEIGVLTPKECELWQNYTDLRNDLSHNHFDKKLRDRLFGCIDKYTADLKLVAEKIIDAGPDIRRIQKKVFECSHNDGLVIQLDLLNHTANPANTEDNFQKEDNVKKHKNIRKEFSSNGIEYSLSGREIVAVKLPNGIGINFDKGSIDWDCNTHFYTNAENFNVLQTERSKIFTDKNFNVTQYLEKNRKQVFKKGDSFMVGYKHHILLDSSCKIKEFKYRDANNNIIRAEFSPSQNSDNSILLSDGTSIVISNGNMMVIHGGEILNYDNRKAFAASYKKTNNDLPQIKKPEKSR
ncbi:MAG: hypothetical protein J6T72_05030 [Alphaproteobacteria bacterium]|nr:hypothetical protein [Alphaproteobacteria bacterium]